ncbi:hypothetical protein JZ751_011665 [Albula glossodonta]|uniref:Uncharacterized protein n=1 Tax=Albula glossodonta TaxID=121402 RepID=A0A8T2PQ97_9TELE|nr:hypothetical protein JZ751_011665 [Albula glossodonta]
MKRRTATAETGVPLNVSIRLQLNLYIKKVSGISNPGNDLWSQRSEPSGLQTPINPPHPPYNLANPCCTLEPRYLTSASSSGYIDGPVLDTFYTNLVVLPAVMEYMQYIFIGLGLLTLLGAFILGMRNQVSHKPQGPTSHTPSCTPPHLTFTSTLSLGACTGKTIHLQLLSAILSECSRTKPCALGRSLFVGRGREARSRMSSRLSLCFVLAGAAGSCSSRAGQILKESVNGKVNEPSCNSGETEKINMTEAGG